MTAGAPEGQGNMARAAQDGLPSPGSMPAIELRFVADLVCPWCYLAFTRLRRLIAPGDVALIWHPYLLNPHLPPQGVARAHYLERKFGSLAQAQRLHDRIREAGAREGMRFSLNVIRRQPCTVAAHALILAAAATGQAAEMAEAVFRAFFQQGADIGDVAVLRCLAEAAGLGEPARRAVNDPRAAQMVRTLHAQAGGFGVNGVPICVLGGDHLIAGAQPVEAMVGLLDLERYRRAGAYGRQAS